MNKHIIPFLCCCILLLMVSCIDDIKPNFDSSLLTGKWQEGTLYERYKSDGTGYTWDVADDVQESEAQPFTWTLEYDELTQIHEMEMGGVVPKTYTVTTLNNSAFVYHDNYGVTHSFVKVVE